MDKKTIIEYFINLKQDLNKCPKVISEETLYTLKTILITPFNFVMMVKDMINEMRLENSNIGNDGVGNNKAYTYKTSNMISSDNQIPQLNNSNLYDTQYKDAA